jgi:hypothetical protein
MAESFESSGGPSFVKIDAVRRSFGELLAGGFFPMGSRLGVMTFQAQTRAGGLLVAGGQEMAKVIVPLTPAASLTREDLDSKLDAIKVSGATPSGIAIEEGLKVMYASDTGEVKRIKKLVLVTDERSNVGPKPEQVVSDEVAEKAIIDVIAIGKRINRETLEKVTSKTGGKFTVIVSPVGLFDAMNPKVRMKGLGVDAGLVEETEKASAELEAGKAGGTTSMEYRLALERARQVRAKANKRLMQVLILKAQAEAVVKRLSAEVSEGLSMNEYAEKVWGSGSELEQVEKVEARLRSAMARLAE